MTPMEQSAIEIAHSVQLAVAPVFLLSAVGLIITVLTNRLARIIDRARKLEDAAPGTVTTDLRDRQEQLRVLGRRARLANRAITLSVICALLVALVVVSIFLNQFIKVDLSTIVALLFILGMLSLISALLLFLREVFLAIAALKIGIRK
jgi:hypothetical protein